MTAVVKGASLRPSDRRHAVKSILTSAAVTACYYASRPHQRPDCERLAVLRYAPTALCADCDRQHFALGEGMDRVLLADPLTLVDVVVAGEACTRAEQALREAVARARKTGQPWSAIGTALGTTRQAAQQRFAAAGQKHRLTCPNEEALLISLDIEASAEHPRSGPGTRVAWGPSVP